MSSISDRSAHNTVPQYHARICYNRKHWQRPSGAEGKSTSDEAFEGQHGYGHEEWLFDPRSDLDGDGWRYGHLEAVGKSRTKLAGRTVDVGLFTLRDNAGRKDRFLVARIRRLEVLDDDQAEAAWLRMKATGRIDEMIREVVAVGGDPTILQKHGGGDIVNVRFRWEDVEIDRGYERPDTRLNDLPNRYQIRENNARWGGPHGWSPGAVPLGFSGAGAGERLRPTDTVTRSSTDSVEVDALHNRLQNALYQRLCALHGADKVRMEVQAGGGRADIQVQDGTQLILIEIKSDSDVRSALRAATGQLIEYAYWPAPGRSGRERLRLVVAAPGALTIEAGLYLKALKERCRVPIEYLQVFEEPARIQWQRSSE